MTKARLEAFSDGVIAILITIMVLELHVPHETGWSALTPLVPIFLTYLLSFVFAFNERSRVGQVCARIAPLVLFLAGGMAMVSRGADIVSNALAALIMLLVVSVALHRRLYLDRPEPARLTLFYLVMSAGGALGGLFTALIAPLVFDWVWEHPLLVLAAAALLPGGAWFDWRKRLGISPAFARSANLAVLLGSRARVTALRGVDEKNAVLALVGDRAAGDSSALPPAGAGRALLALC